MPNLKNRYLIALILLAFFITSGALFLHYVLSIKEHDARVINIAGRQRMLSQKIAKTSLKIEQVSEAERIKVSRELEEALTLFETSHNALEFGSEALDIEPRYGEDITGAYSELRPLHEEMLKDGQIVLSTSRINDTIGFQNARNRIQEHEAQFLQQMDKIVFAHDKEASDRLSLSIVSVYIFSGTLITALLLLWLFLIRPTLKRSQQIEQEKTTFIKLASHQLRTPLSSINWFIEMLGEEKKKFSKAQVEYIEEVTTGAQRMKEVVNSLIVFSTLDEREKEMPVSLQKLIEQTLQKHESTIEEKEIEVHQNVPEAPLTYTADESKLLYVIDTLIDNAIHYTRAKDLIVITLEQKGKEIIFSVRDTGIGIPESEHEYIGTTFFRAKNATQIDHDGTGINLKISKTIAESLGGSLTFKSRENAGSTFVVRLPMK